MRKILTALLLSITILSYAQDATKKPITVAENIVITDVPRSLDIKDKVFVNNKTPYKIERIVVALATEVDQYQPLWSAENIAVGDVVEIASYKDNELKNLRRKKLALKIKGKNSKSQEITYNFDVRLYDSRHDLYIELTSKNPNDNKSIMDF